MDASKTAEGFRIDAVGEWVFVEQDTVGEKTESGIYLPASTAARPMETGIVKSAGPTTPFNAGDRVVLPGFIEFTMTVDKKAVAVVHMSGIAGRIRGVETSNAAPSAS